MHKINKTFIITLIVGMIAAAQNYSLVSANTENVDFDVNITEALTVSVSNPTTWASGSVDSLLRNKVTVTALTNNNNGVTVSMYAAGTNLQNTKTYDSGTPATYIPTLNNSTSTHGNFPTDSWGYSLEDTAVGSNDASYLPMTTSSSPITVLTSSLGTQGSKDVYFGAKASSSKQSGTYAQTVYFVAVTDTIDTSTNPQNPSNPSGPSQPDETAVYTGSTGTGTPAGQTTYTTRNRSGSGTSSVSGSADTTTTQVSKGDTSSSYVRAAGVTSATPTTTTTDSTSALGIALASTAAVAAASGIIFLAAAKRRKDDDD